MAGKIFISYARPDKDSVHQIYNELISAGHDPWLDVENILPGEKWQRAINNAIEKTDFFLIILSKNSYDRRGVIQKEISLALDKMQEFLPEDLFIIPLRLDSCEIPDRLKYLQVLDWDDGRGLRRLLDAIQFGLDKRKIETLSEREREKQSENKELLKRPSTDSQYQIQSNMALSKKKADIIKSITAGFLLFLFILGVIVIMKEGKNAIRDIWWQLTSSTVEEQFSYQVHVKDENTDQPIHNAKVRLGIGGITPKTKITDNNGVAIFMLEQSIDGKTVRLTIEAKGYESYEEYIGVTIDEVPKLVLLKVKEP